jgi:hypothetical protein
MMVRYLSVALCACWSLSCGCSKDGGEAEKARQTTAETAPASALRNTPQTQAAPKTQATQADTGAGADQQGAIPLYFERALATSELETRSLRELSLMRNTIFARGGNKFRKTWLREYFTAQPWYREAEKMDESQLSDIDWQNAKLIAQIERSFSKGQLDERKNQLLGALGNATPTAEQRVELELLSRRIGKWVGPDTIGMDERSPLEDPAMLERILGLAELEDMSLKDLRILRNTVYARRGYVFKSAILDEYFGNMDWYQADPSYTDDRLSSVDWKNIKLIKSVETSLGGPIGDTVHEEYDWFDAA